MLRRQVMRTGAIVVVMAGIVLIGCATTKDPRSVWTGDLGRFREHNYECTRDSRTWWSAGGSGLAGALAQIEAKDRAESEARSMYIMGMESKGYVLQCPPGTCLNKDR